MSGACALCGSDALRIFLDRRGVPVHQNLPRADRESARGVRRGDLRLACCGACGFIGNVAFDAALTEYGADYDNDQNWSPRFDAHVDALVSRLIAAGVRGQEVVEVGCGKGSFLRRLCERGDNRGIGFDPSYVGPAETDGGRVTFVREMYGAGHRHVAPDAVVCRHVIEHVPRPLELLADVRSALDRPARLFFETPDVQWILDGLVVQDFFYEHCSYFTPETLAGAFVRAGFAEPRVERVFGDQYLWLEARHDPASSRGGDPPATPALLAAALRYQERETSRLASLRSALERLASDGAVAAWGAGAKGVTFLNLLDPDAALVDCVVDINPRKQGLFLPGSAHPIVGPAAMAGRGIGSVVVMNANYLEEIRALVRDAGLQARIYDEAEL